MLLVVGILGVLYLVLPVKVIEFSQQDVDNAIKSKIPYAIVDGIAHVTISAATLQLRHENMITGNISFEAAAITLEGVGVSTFESGVRYQSGNFYLADLKKDDIQFEFSSNSIETMGDVRSTLEDLLNREATEAAANQDVEKASRINSVRVYAETQLKIDVEVALDKFIKNAPIFSLND